MLPQSGLDTRLGAAWARDSEELQRRVSAAGDWYEQVIFANGARTPGRSPSTRKLEALALPGRLDGYSVLDVGAYEGFYSAHMEQRGASVTANDHYVWNASGSTARSNFELLRSAVGGKYKTLEVDIFDLSGPRHDIVLFLGVLYHLENPVEALRRVHGLASRVVVFETLVDSLHQQGSQAAVYSDLNGDATNFLGPNLAALESWFVRAGFRNWEFKSLWDCNTVTQLGGSISLSPLSSGRVVYWLEP